MSQFDKIEDFISELYKHRKLLATLFEKRRVSVHSDEVLPLVDNDMEVLKQLDSFELVHAEKNLVSMNGRLREFFEDFLEVDETVHVLYVQEYLDKIEELKVYFERETSPRQKDEYLLLIKNNLRRIQRITIQNIKTLRRNMDEAYKSAANFDIKREKLNYLRNQRDALEQLLRVVNQMLCDDQFFRTTSDEELLYIIHHVKVTLHESRHNLIEIQQQIIEYLNQIEFRAEIMKKVLRLKTLRDKFQLKEHSNFHEVVNRLNDSPLLPQESYRTRLAARQLIEEPEMHNIILKVRQKVSTRKLLESSHAGDIASEALADSDQKEQVINLEALKNLFIKGKDDLFTFVMNHDFSQHISDRKRLWLYCGVASLFENELDFTDENQYWQGLEYALIYPKNK